MKNQKKKKNKTTKNFDSTDTSLVVFVVEEKNKTIRSG
jgi:hypothetical protein